MVREFEYNGWWVRTIGPVIKVSGGFVARVKIVDCPDYVIDSKFNAVVDCNGSPK